MPLSTWSGLISLKRRRRRSHLDRAATRTLGRVGAARRRIPRGPGRARNSMQRALRGECTLCRVLHTPFQATRSDRRRGDAISHPECGRAQGGEGAGTRRRGSFRRAGDFARAPSSHSRRRVRPRRRRGRVHGAADVWVREAGSLRTARPSHKDRTPRGERSPRFARRHRAGERCSTRQRTSIRPRTLAAARRREEGRQAS